MLDVNNKRATLTTAKLTERSPSVQEKSEMLAKEIRVADDFQFACADIVQYTTDDLATSYLNNYQRLLKPIKWFLTHYAKDFPKLMRLLDYDQFIITKATFMGEGGEKIVLRVTARIKESDENNSNQPLEVGFGLRLHKGKGETFADVYNGLENEFKQFKLFRRLNGVAIIFHKLYGTHSVINNEVNCSDLENDKFRDGLLQNHIYLVSVGEFVEGLDVGEILERDNYTIDFKKNVIMESAKTLARTWLLSLQSEPPGTPQTENRVGCVITDLHDGQVVWLRKPLTHLMRVVIIDLGAFMYIDRIRFTKTLITFVEGELKIIGLSNSQKDLTLIMNGVLAEIDSTASMIEPHFLTETEFHQEASQLRRILVQSI